MGLPPLFQKKVCTCIHMCTVFHVTFCISVCGWGFGRRENDGSTRPEKEADAGSLWSETDSGR